jgi:hypothetical protein
MKSITIFGGNNWLELKILSRGVYRVVEASVREVGNPIIARTLLSVAKKEGVSDLSESEYTGIFVAEWRGLRFDFSDQDNLTIFGSLRFIREALCEGIIICTCVGDE